MQVVLPSRLELPFHGMSFVENLLITKSTNELNFTQARDPMLTVEIDLDSLPDSPYGYGQLVESCLAPLAAAKPDLRASIYVSHRPSVSFGNYGSSALFGIAGDSRVLAALFSCFRNAPGLKVGHGDQIIQSEALRQYHIEGGLLWRPDEEHVWYANEVDHKNGRPNDNIEFGPGRDPGIELDPEPEQGPEAAALGARTFPRRAFGCQCRQHCCHHRGGVRTTRRVSRAARSGQKSASFRRDHSHLAKALGMSSAQRCCEWAECCPAKCPLVVH
jgi:hypothetical protein